MNFLSLFAGIGGFDLGLERTGMKCVGQVEINPFCQKILKKHWPNVKRMGDIHNVRGNEFGAVDLVCGGVPCQPASTAGKQKGAADDRWLWPETFRVVRAIKPTWCLFENVRGLLTLEDGVVFKNLLSELEGVGYETLPFIIPACAVNAPHRRDRVWIVANNVTDTKNPNGGRPTDKEYSGRRLKEIGGSNRHAADTSNQGLQRSERPGAHDTGEKVAHGSTTERNPAWDEPWLEAATRLCRMDARISSRVDRLKALGNAVVPQIVEIIGRAILYANH